MFEIACVVFKETFEAALLIGLLASCVSHLTGYRFWIKSGIFIGLLGSIILAWLMGKMTEIESGQEWIQIGLLTTAWLSMAAHVLTAKQDGKNRAFEIKRQFATSETSSMLPILLVSAIAVLREGSETVLFVAGLSHVNPSGQGISWLGVFLGLSLGVAAGWLIFHSMRWINRRHVFTINQIFMTVIMGNLLLNIIQLLEQANVLTDTTETAWNLENILSEKSLLGQILHSFFGYQSAPTLLKISAFIACLIGITLCNHLNNLKGRNHDRVYA